MRYAGFWKRFFAAWVDFFVLIPMGLLNNWLAGGPKPHFIAAQILISCLAWLYFLYFQARWGQTIGKMALGIRIVKVNGDPIGWRGALLRNAVDGGLSLLALIGMVIAIVNVPDSQYRTADWLGRARLLQEATPAALGWMPWALNIWAWSERITLLCNTKRRALHDFIAGTVVMRLDPVADAGLRSSSAAVRPIP